MEFTKEEIKTALLLLAEYEGNSLPINFEDYLKSKLKPETKKIRVEIECINPDSVLTFEGLEDYLSLRGTFKVTELKDVWSDEEVKHFLKRFCFDFDINITTISIEEAFTNFKAERSSK